jgi:hypothetical protein
MDTSTALLFAFIVNLIAWVGCVAYVLGFKRMPSYHPLVIFLIYFLLGYVYQPLADLISGGSTVWNTVGYFPTPEDIVFATLVDVVGILSFIFVPPLLINGIHDDLEMPAISLEITNQVGFLITASIAAAAGLLSIYHLLSTNTDTVVNITQRLLPGGGTAFTGDSSGYQNVGAEFIPPLLIILYFRYGFTRFNLAVTGLYMFIIMYMGVNRAGFLTIALGAIVVYLMRSGTKYFRLRHIVFGIVLLVAFDIIGGNRFIIREMLSGQQNTVVENERWQNIRNHGSMLADMQEFESMTLVTSIIPDRSNSYNWFTQYGSLLVRPIPRTFWPDKPVDTSILSMVDYGNFYYLTFSMIADAYINMGLPSVVLIMALDSFLLCFLYKAIQRTTSANLLLLFTLIVAYLPVLYRDGGWPASGYFVIASMFGAWVMIVCGGIRIIRRQTITDSVPKAEPEPHVSVA